jgi:hypothetical protein
MSASEHWIVSCLVSHLVPACDSQLDVAMLRALGSGSKQEHVGGIHSSEIHAVAWPAIDSQFPDPLPAKFRVASITCRETIDAPQDRYPATRISKTVQPILEYVLARARDVVVDP